MRRCVPINEIEIGIKDEIERLSSWREIEWISLLDEIKFKRNDIKTKLNAQRTPIHEFECNCDKNWAENL